MTMRRNGWIEYQTPAADTITDLYWRRPEPMTPERFLQIGKNVNVRSQVCTVLLEHHHPDPIAVTMPVEGGYIRIVIPHRASARGAKAEVYKRGEIPEAVIAWHAEKYAEMYKTLERIPEPT